MEQWYNSGRQDAARVDVSYLTGATVTSLLNSAGTWTPIAALGVDAPSTTTVISNRDGNSPSNRRVRQITLANLNLADGQEIMLRWSYVLNNTTNGNGLSIDDVLVTPVTNIFYSKATGNLDALTSWGINTDGSGTAPASFSEPNTTYYVHGTATTSRISGNPGFPNKTTWTVTGTNSKVVIGVPSTTGTNLTLANDDDINAIVDVGAGSTFTTQQPIPNFRLGRIDNSSTVEYITTGQPINITEASYGNLKVNGAGAKLLTANTVVNGSLILTANAKLQLGDNSLSIIRGGAVTGASGTAFVVTNGKGTLRQSVANSGGDVLFPVGASTTSYTPAWLQQPSSTTARNEDVFAVRVIDKMYGHYDANENGTSEVQNQNVKKTWLVSEEVPGNSDVRMKLQWNTVDQVSGGGESTNFDPAKAYIGHYLSNGSVPYFDKVAPASAATGTVANSYQISRSGLTSFSPYAVSSNLAGPLPVELAAFGAERLGETVQCSWKTASEKNSSHFVVERSLNGQDFQALGTVAGAGTSSSSHSYRFLDAAPVASTAYYRLRQLDLDGAATYSHVVVVRGCNPCGTAQAKLAVVPNPSAAYAQVVGSSGVAVPLHGTLYTVLGTVRLQLNGQTSVDLSGQPSGVYVLRLSTEQGPVTLRLVKE